MKDEFKKKKKKPEYKWLRGEARYQGRKWTCTKPENGHVRFSISQARGRARGSSRSSSLRGGLTFDFHDTFKSTIDSTLKHENKENQESKFCARHGILTPIHHLA